MISKRNRNQLWRLPLWMASLALAFQLYGQGGQTQNPPNTQGNLRNAARQALANMQAARRGATQQNQAGSGQTNARGAMPPNQQANPQQARPGMTSPNQQPMRQPQPGAVQPQPGMMPAQSIVNQQNRPGMMQSNRPGVVQTNLTGEPPSMKMRLEGAELTGMVRNTPLQQVLGELSAWSGIVFEIESQENPSVSLSLYRVSVPEAVQRLTGNNNSIVYYDRDEAGQSRISFVRVFTRTPRPLPPSLHYIGTGSITKRSDDIVDSPEQALAVLAGSDNLVARQRAIEVLVAAKGAPAIQALKTVLTDPAMEVRVAAIEGLASLGARDALPQILPFLKDSHPGVRQSAVLAVGLLGEAANMSDLKPLLRDPDPSVAASVQVAMQKLAAR